MRLTRLRNGKEKAEQYIGYLNGKSPVIAYNEAKSLESGATSVDLKCSKCGTIYTAPLAQVLYGKYKLCPNCKEISSSVKDIPEGEEYGDYIVKKFVYTEKGRSYWECYSISKQCNVIVSYDTMYQSRRSKMISKEYNNTIKAPKIPFTFINKK